MDDYLFSNLGRIHYEYVVQVMKKMKKIANGDETVKKLLDKYKTLYKNRRAMIEEFNKINYR